METQNTSDLLLDLITFADELPNISKTEALELAQLLKKLPQAAKSERAAATKHLSSVKAERDDALEQLEQVKSEHELLSLELSNVQSQLAIAVDENQRLRAEVGHVQEKLKTKKKPHGGEVNGTRKAKGRSSSREGTRSGRMQETVMSPPVSLKDQEGASLLSQPQHNSQLRRRSDTIEDPRRISITPSTAGNNSVRPLPRSAKGGDSYRPTNPLAASSPPTNANAARHPHDHHRASRLAGVFTAERASRTEFPTPATAPCSAAAPSSWT